MMHWQGLRHRHEGSAAALDFGDFSAAAGERVLLRGPSGSGKSTLLALLAGLLTPSAGRLQVAGADLTGLSSRARDVWRGECIGFVPQRLHLSASLSVSDNLALPYIAAGLPVDAARISKLLAQLGLQGLDRRRPGELSVGQAQRVALARAVLRRPRLVLADEPTAHLDDDSAQMALDLLDQLASEIGAGLLIATHDARLVQRLPSARQIQLDGLPVLGPT